MVVLSIGGNLGNRLENISHAIDYIEEQIGTILHCSSVYESEAWGFKTKHRFLNVTVAVETLLQPESLLQKTLEIETIMGRVRNKTGYASRTMDIDILFIDNKIIDTQTLTIPHPRLHKRRFILLPLSEIIPDKIHPVFQKNIATLLAECNDKGKVRML